MRAAKYLWSLCALCVLCGGILEASWRWRPLASLVYTGADTDNVNCGSGSTLDNHTAFTWYAWVYQTADVGSAHRAVVTKLTADVVSGKTFWVNGASGGGNVNRMRAQIQRATTSASFIGNNNTFVTALNTWTFVALTYDETDGPRGWRGNLTTPVAEITYSSGPAVGSGATSTDASANLYIGNRCPNSTCNNDSFPGRIAVVAVYNRRFTQQELLTHQARPFCSKDAGCVASYRLGMAQGTGTQADLSGNGNNCTVTGATAADHAPTSR